MICMYGWILRRRATASATALFGPWPYSPFVGGAFAPRLSGAGCDFGLGGDFVNIAYNIEKGASSSSSGGRRKGVANNTNRFVSFAAPGYGEGPVRYSNYAPMTASSQWRLRR